LDRYHVKASDLNPVELEGRMVFYKNVYLQTNQQLTDAILDKIQIERNGGSVDRDLLRNVTSVFPSLEVAKSGVYVQDFEDDFLVASHKHFRRLRCDWLENDSFPEYLQKVEVTLNDETDRCEQYLQRSSANKVQMIAVQVLLEEPLQTLLEKDTALEHMLTYDKREDLRRTWTLFSLSNNGMNELASAVKKFIINRGNRLISDYEHSLTTNGPRNAAAESSELIKNLLETLGDYKDLVSKCFDMHFTQRKALKEAFETFMNRDLGKNPLSKQMAQFCDRILKKGGGGDKLSENQIEAFIGKIVELFGYLGDKDLFADVYRMTLAKRLLYETSTSDDAEKFMITQLKQKCGAQFTAKLEGMINDLSVATDLQRDYLEYLQSNNKAKAEMAGIEFGVQVLATGSWPSYPALDIPLPPRMNFCLTSFQEFYFAKSEMHKSRRLSWIHSLGSAVVQGVFGTRKHDFYCNTYQAVLLLLFTGCSTLSFSIIRNSLANLEETLVRKLIGSLFLGNFQIIKKVRKSNTSAKGVSVDDEFEVNMEFRSQQKRIKIPTPVQEDTHNKERVEEDRTHAIQAAIVRIMKARKELPHHQLVNEVIAMLHFFRPQPKLIKQKIEQLIERDFLERDVGDPQLYRYLA